jgi:hypothetical protein
MNAKSQDLKAKNVERWGTFSVKDHLQATPFVTDLCARTYLVVFRFPAAFAESFVQTHPSFGASAPNQLSVITFFRV